jgi:hypothetical protein
LDEGQSVAPDDIMSITVLGNFLSGVTFSPITVKFQSDADAEPFEGTVRSVPEPSSLTLFLSGLALAAAGRFRRRKN